MRKFQVLEFANTKLQQVKWLKDRDGFVFVVKVLETPIAHDWRKDVSSQTVVECWRRHG